MRLHGHWQNRRLAPDARAVLVVEVDGQRHRFPAVRPPRLARIGRSGSWASNFALPAWLAPRLEGHTVLSIGDVEVEVRGLTPSGNGSMSPPPRDEGGIVKVDSKPEPGGSASDGMAPRADNEVSEAADLPEVPAAPPEPGDGVIPVLRAELAERAAAQGRIQGELADTKAELAARVANQERLRATHEQLRAELERLSGLVRQHDNQRAEVESRAVVLAAELSDAQAQVGDLVATREELRAERDVLLHEVASLRAALAAGIVTSDAATAEAEGLREELERLGAELGGARQALGSQESGLDEAEALLGEARALTASLREP